MFNTNFPFMMTLEKVETQNLVGGSLIRNFLSSDLLQIVSHFSIFFIMPDANFQWGKWSFSKGKFWWIDLASKNFIFYFPDWKSHLRIIPGKRSGCKKCQLCAVGNFGKTRMINDENDVSPEQPLFYCVWETIAIYLNFVSQSD